MLEDINKVKKRLLAEDNDALKNIQEDQSQN
jgi:hypothetical protein